MKLSTFLLQRIDVLLEEWDRAALIIAPDLEHASFEALRDHARQMLEFIARDIEQPQTNLQQLVKSQGQENGNGEDFQNVGSVHGIQRQVLGFSLKEVLVEHRALRATVTRVWGEEQGGLQTDDIAELVRFNESMDYLVGEAVSGFSDQKEQETRLFAETLSFSPDPSGIFDRDGKLIYINPAMAEVLQTPKEDAVGKDLFELSIPFAAEFHQQLEYTISSGLTSQIEVSSAAESGKERTYDALLAPVRDKEGNIRAASTTYRDITERKANEDLAWRHANYDGLTDIPNRRLFLDRLDQAMRESARRSNGFALLFIDLDHFKEANDLLGHGAGDTLLKLVAERLGACVRDMDTLARLGGDEFTILLKDIAEPDKVEVIANSVLESLERPFSIQGQTVHISGSIGITFFPQDGATVDSLIHNADQAMYNAKRLGGCQYCIFQNPGTSGH